MALHLVFLGPTLRGSMVRLKECRTTIGRYRNFRTLFQICSVRSRSKHDLALSGLECVCRVWDGSSKVWDGPSQVWDGASWGWIAPIAEFPIASHQSPIVLQVLIDTSLQPAGPVRHGEMDTNNGAS